VDDHPDGFEWCVNQPAVDAHGVIYANSEDGFLYAIGRDGAVREKIFLNLALGAAYTPVSLGRDGRIYAQNNGHLFVIGFPVEGRSIPVRPPAPAHGPSVVPRR
jgi:outer membrane protein assembly factor BamB